MPIMLLEGASSIDTSAVTEIVNLLKTLMGLFGEFPLNFILIGGLAGIAFGIFRKAKAAAGGGK